jgi:hypothetical protein
METSGKLLWTRSWTFGLSKTLEISWLAEGLLNTYCRENNTQGTLREDARKIHWTEGRISIKIVKHFLEIGFSNLQSNGEHVQILDVLTLGVGTDRLSRNVDKQLPHDVGNTPEERRAHQHRGEAGNRCVNIFYFFIDTVSRWTWNFTTNIFINRVRNQCNTCYDVCEYMALAARNANKLGNVRTTPTTPTFVQVLQKP